MVACQIQKMRTVADRMMAKHKQSFELRGECLNWEPEEGGAGGDIIERNSNERVVI